MTDRKCQRFTAFLPFLAALATLVLFAGSTRVSAAAPPVPPAEGDNMLPETSDSGHDSASPSEDSGTTNTSEIFEFSQGTILGFSEAYLENTAQSGGSITLTIPDKINGVSVTAIGDRAFYGLKNLTGVLRLPAAITRIGTEAFYGTGLSTVYLPSSLSACGASAFDSGPVLVFPDQTCFEKFASSDMTTDWKRAGYLLKLTLQNVNGTKTQRQVLYNLPLSYTKNAQDEWKKDSSWKLPAIPAEDGYSSGRWVFDPSDSDAKSVTEDTSVTGDTLYAVRSIVPPEISFGKDINCEYDGKEHTLSVRSSHPLYSSSDTAEEGDVLFFYTWNWEENGQKQEKKGYDLSSLSFTLACDLSVTVDVEAQVKAAEGGTSSVLAKKSHTWTVQITEPESPEVSESSTPTESPDSLDVPGTQESSGSNESSGSGESKDPAGSGNEKLPSEATDSENTSGSESSSGSGNSSVFSCQIEIQGNSGGSVDPEGKLTIQNGSKITFTFTPDPGFCIQKVMLDGENVTAQIKENRYTPEPQSLSADHDPHKLSVSFRRLKKAELLELFKALPPLDGTTDYSEETKDAYLDAWIQYQALQKNGGMRLGSEVLQTYYKNLSCLPCFDLKVNVDEKVKDLVSVPDVSPVLSSLTQEEAQGLLDGNITKISFLLEITPANLDETQEQAILSLLDSPVLMESFQAALEKTVEKQGASNTWTSFPSGPSLTLRCSFAGAKPHEKGYERTFYIAMQKKASGETDDAALMKTKTTKKTVLTAEASSFPAVFTLLYQDRKAGGETGTTETPSESESPSSSQPGDVSGNNPSGGGSSGGNTSSESSSESSSSGSTSSSSSSSSSSSGSGSSGNQNSGKNDSGDNDSRDNDSRNNDSGNNDSRNNDSATHVPDYEKEFWEDVRSLIQQAKAGETVNVNAVTWDKMPENVMDALRKNPHVALIVRWDGGDPVIIPALTALAKEEGRVYYPLSYLSGLYKTINAALTQPVPQPSATPQLTAPAQPSSSYTPTPESMGVKRPQNTQDGSQTQDTEESAEPETAAEPEGSLPAPSSENTSAEPLNTVQVSQVQRSPVTIIVLVASAALLILVLILIAVLLTLKKK